VEEVGITESELTEINEGFRAIIDNEFSFLDNIFASPQSDVLPIDLKELKAYIKFRANDRLRNLGLEPCIAMTSQESILARRVIDWFEPMAKGQISHDFFARAKAGDNYVSKPTQDFESVNLSALSLELV
jgi:ribonucleotide reductase beta subunit family protein with ferritin-like domain